MRENIFIIFVENNSHVSRPTEFKLVLLRVNYSFAGFDCCLSSLSIEERGSRPGAVNNLLLPATVFLFPDS